MQLVYTTISPEYCPNWGVKEALRELFQEAMDVRTVFGCNSEVRYDAGRVVIEDDGPGIPISALVMGKSGKRDNPDTIGQFGEGLKLACLVLARVGRHVRISTAGYELVPHIAVSPTFGCEVLAFSMAPNDRPSGTTITVEAAEEEYVEVADMFLALSPSGRFYVPLEGGGRRRATVGDEIFLPGGRLFVQGVEVAVPGEADAPLFSYNIPVKCVQSRDRWAIDLETMRKAIAEAWARCENPALIGQLLEAVRAGKPCLEVSSGYVPDQWNVRVQAAELWRNKAAEVFSNCVVGDSLAPPQMQRISELGYRVIAPHYRVQWLLTSLGVRTVSDIEDQLVRYEEVAVRELSPLQRYNLDQLRRIFKRYLAKDAGARLVPARMLDERVGGLYERGTMYISIDVLGQDLRQALMVLVHEYAHHLSGAGDYTSGFQRALEGMVADLLLARAARRAS